MFNDIGHQVEKDLQLSEAISLPIVLTLLVMIFGGVVAAGVPLGMGLLAIVGTFLVLRTLSELTEVAVYSLSVATALGLGLAIDYGLLLLSRYREEFHAGRGHEDAIVAAVATAGRTIVFSGLTVAVSHHALLLFPVAFLRSFAFAGYGVLAVAVAGALLVMPAALAALGSKRVAAGRRQRRQTAGAGTGGADEAPGFWYRAAKRVMGRAVPVTVVIVAVLLVLGLPHPRRQLRPARPPLPARGTPPPARPRSSSTPSSRRRRRRHPVVASTHRRRRRPAAGHRPLRHHAFRALRRGPGRRRHRHLRRRPAPRRARPGRRPLRSPAGDATWLAVTAAVEPLSRRRRALVKAIRATPSPLAEVGVTGPGASLVDTKASIGRRLPYALAWMGLATFVLLFLSLGSVLVSAKAVILNFLA